jgi:hypothetical protein
MEDNVLKKEFSQKDVQRVRNLVQGKYGDKTQQSIGYSKKEEFHSKKVIFGKKMDVNGLSKMVLNKILQIR